MSFIETLRRARTLLSQERRLSVRALQREFGLEGQAFDDLLDELVTVQGVASREGDVLVWLPDGAEPRSVHERPPVAPAAAERRQLTVVFCDLVGSTALAAALDPEDWREIVRSYQEMVAAVVTQFEGSVAQHVGDGLLLYFGYPLGHEDDAERGVRAGLGIVERVGELNHELAPRHRVRLAVRVGVHTGPVVVGEVGDALQREVLAFGSTTNVAARLQDHAAPDTVVLSAATLRLAQGVFVTEDLGALQLKGLAEPLHAFCAERALGVRSRFDALASGRGPLVGRDQEFGALLSSWERARKGAGQAVLLGGDAGIGKSRLVHAFRERITEEGHTWLECHGTPYTSGTALFPVVELQRQGMYLTLEDPPERTIPQVKAALAAAGLGSERNVQLIADLHNLEYVPSEPLRGLSPGGRREQTLTLLCKWLLSLGQSQPVVLLMEDLQWLDPTSIDLLQRIVEQLPTSRLLVLATHRTEYEPPFRQCGHVTPLRLARLGDADMRRLITAAAGREAGIRAAWLDEIIRRSDGVPLYGEELARSTMAEVDARSGPRERLVPETLQASLTARLDRLGPAREVVQVGAVLGREFSYRLLQKVSGLDGATLDDALARATAQELLFQRDTPPESSYLFKHALIRDAAYGSLLRAARRTYHRRAAEILAERFPAIAAFQPELVAQHFADGDAAEQAIDWWLVAAESAERRGANEEGMSHLRAALARLSDVATEQRGPREFKLQAALARLLSAARGWGHDETVEGLRRARELCDHEQDPVERAAIFYASASASIYLGQHAESLEPYARVLDIGERADDRRLQGAARLGMAISHFYQGRFRESLAYLDAAIGLFGPDPEPLTRFAAEDLGVALSVWDGWISWFCGLPDRSRAATMRSIERARARNDGFSLAFALTFGATAAIQMRCPDRAQALAEEASRVASELGFPMHEALAEMLLGLVRIARGDAGGLEQHAAGMSRLATSRVLGGASVTFELLVYGMAELGLLVEATAALDLADAMIVPGEACCDAELRRLRGELSLRGDAPDPERAETAFGEALVLAERQGATSFALRAATSLARLLAARDGRDRAIAVLRPVHRRLTEGHDTADVRDARHLLDELSA